MEKMGQPLFITMVCVGPTVSNLTNVCFTEKVGEVREESHRIKGERSMFRRGGEVRKTRIK